MHFNVLRSVRVVLLINPTGATIYGAKPNNAGIQNPNPVFYQPGT
jgi:hypothetical protein